jgi:hypothetical protein
VAEQLPQPGGDRMQLSGMWQRTVHGLTHPRQED